MGKKVKKKIRNTQKERRDLSGSKDETTPVNLDGPAEAVGDDVLAVKRRITCPHIKNGVNLDNVSGKLGSNCMKSCEDCREGSSRKGRSKHGNKGTSAVGKKKECVWVCLQCGHFSCGGVGLPTTPQSHAIRHNKQTRHPYVVQLQNPNLCWCFPCSSLIPVGKLVEDDDLQNNALLDVVKLIKGGVSEGPSIDVEDVWFGGGTILGATGSLVSGKTGGRVVRGLGNLGNTCFFNSIMQNLLATDQLRDYLLKLDRSVGPLTMALKKLFNEASGEDSRHGISPKNLFGCICSRAPQFRGYQQQDSHELLRCLLDGLCIEELNVRKTLNSSKADGITSNPSSTFVDEIFGGQLSSTVTCMECKHSSIVFEPFLDLSLPLPTKKSPSKKGPVVSRSRKGKLPLKYEARKRGQNRGKGKLDSAPALVPCPTGSSETIDSSSLASSSVPPKEEIVDSSETWLDFLGPDTASDAPDSDFQSCDISSIQVSESKHISHNDDMLQNSSGSQTQVFSPSTEPEQNSDLSKGNSSENDVPLLQGSEVLLQETPQNISGSQTQVFSPNIELKQNSELSNGNFSDLPLVQDSEVLVEVALQNSSGSQTQVFSPDIEPKQDSELSKGKSSVNDLPLVQDSEVLLLPYKEASSTIGTIMSEDCEASSSALGCEQDSLDIDGFGDLFNEPEVASVTNLVNKSSQESEVTKTGFVAGNSSESDPDEVDDRDAPVSINSCLAFFTKPELLSDLAWHCENCSKTLRNQQVYFGEDQTKMTLEKKNNGVQLGSQNDPSDGDLLVSIAESRSLENGNIASDVGSTIERDEDHLQSRLTPPEVSPSMSDCKSSTQTSVVDQASESSSVNGSDCTGSNVDQVNCMVSQTEAKAPGSKGSDKVSGKCVKVMRNATKRILINKLPPVLTIHLKRFSQDTRGRLNKLSGHVSFQERIDLSPYMSHRSSEEDKCEYQLIGVVEHSGTMRGGHYVAYVRGEKRKGGKTEQDNEGHTWFYASDAHVREVSLEIVCRSEAYILFYEKI